MKLLILILFTINSLLALNLTNEEEKYLKQNSSFTICDHYNTYPISGVKDGKLIGISGDYYNEISKRTGISFKAISSLNHLDLNKKVKSNQCDLVSILAKNQKRFTNVKNTKDVFSFPHVAMGNIQGAFFDSSISYEGHTFIVRVKSFKKRLLKVYPHLNIKIINDIPTILKLIKKDSKTHLIAAKPIIERIIQKNGFDKYKINGIIDGVYTNITLGVDKRHMKLLNIINKTIDDIDNIKVNEIIDNHSIKKFHIDNKTNKYLLASLALLVILIILLLYISRAKEKKQAFKLQQLLKKTEQINTQLEKSNHLLAKEKERFELAINGSESGMFDWDIGSDSVYLSPKWKSLIGYEDKEIENNFKEWEKRVHPDDLSNTMKIVEEYFEGKTILYNANFRMKHKAGHWVWINARGKASRDSNGNPTRMVGFHSDITEVMEYRTLLEEKVQEQIEKLRRNDNLLIEQSKMAAMGEMIGNIAHQWRQPLNTISTAASGINIEKEIGNLDDERLNHYTQTIENNAKYLSETIDTFKNFIKGEKNLKNEPIQYEIKQALNIISSSLKNNYIKLFNNINDEEQIEIFVVPGELSQVIMNILNNSKDILLEKKVNDPWIKLDLIIEKDNVTITIEDNAGGIPDNVMPKIFEPYFTTKHKSQGTGLGLHMSYKIITESLKGKIWAENSQNGAILFIELPLNTNS